MEQSTQVFIPIIGNLVRYFVLAGLAFLIFYKIFPKYFIKNKIQSKSANSKDFIFEILHSIQSSIIIGVIIALFIFTPIRAYSQIYTEFSDFPTWWLPLSVVLALVIHDTYFYWMHRSLHHPMLYKRMHLVHHKSTNPSPWASFSFHFYEGITEALVVPFVIFLIPMHPIALGLFGLTSLFINVYGHLGFEVAPKWFRGSYLFEILNTSVHHNIHHAKFKGNYGLYFRIWDRLMGTEHPDYVKEYDAIQEKRFGLSHSSSKKASFLTILFLCSISFSVIGQTTIEGKWKDVEKGGVIEIFEKDGKYFGQLISTDDPDKNQQIGDKVIMILKDFEKNNENELCCGNIFQPEHKRTISGSLTLIDPSTLQIKGWYGPFSKSRSWSRM